MPRDKAITDSRPFSASMPETYRVRGATQTVGHSRRAQGRRGCERATDTRIIRAFTLGLNST